jgi:prepilin-type N-terminal cleavage/methylation domain-containing protein
MRNQGFTLLEAMVSVVIFSILAVAFFAASSSALRAKTEQQARSELLFAGQSATRAIQDELRGAGRVTVNYSGTHVSFPYYFSQGAASGFFAIAPHDLAHAAPASSVVLANAIAAAATGSLFLSTAGTPTREIVFLKPGFTGYQNPRTMVPDVDPATAGIKWRKNALLSFRLQPAQDGVQELVETIVNASGAAAVAPDGALYDGATKHVLGRYIERVVFEDPSVLPSLSADQIRVTLYLVKLDARGAPVFAVVSSIVDMRNSDPSNLALTE